MSQHTKKLFVFSVGLAMMFAGYFLPSGDSRLEARLPERAASPRTSRVEVSPGNTYDGVPLPLVGDRNIATDRPTCAACASADPAEWHRYTCQQHNLKHDSKYRGIEVGENRWMQMACAEAHESVQQGGGPFGAVIVQIDDETNEVIRYWRCRNAVTKSVDPTAHAEVTAIRTASSDLGVFDLGEIRRDNPALKLPQTGATSHCEIYSSCEPCPMCYAAVRWARIDTIVFAATRYDAAEPGVDFSDLDLYRELATPYADRHDGNLRVFQATTSNSLDAFNLWKNTDKVAY